MVRLVRACGSKQNYRDYVPKATPGQARKSLWIETGMMGNIQKESTVRLVRACGSKRDNQQSLQHILRVRLVRACGSKLLRPPCFKGVCWVRLVRACGSKQLSE